MAFARPTSFREFMVGLAQALKIGSTADLSHLWEIFQETDALYRRSRKRSMSFTDAVDIILGKYSVPKKDYRDFYSILGAMGSYRRNHEPKRRLVPKLPQGHYVPDDLRRRNKHHLQHSG